MALNGLPKFFDFGFFDGTAGWPGVNWGHFGRRCALDLQRRLAPCVPHTAPPCPLPLHDGWRAWLMTACMQCRQATSHQHQVLWVLVSHPLPPPAAPLCGGGTGAGGAGGACDVGQRRGHGLYFLHD